MGRWIEVAPGKKKLVEGEPSEEDRRIGAERLGPMLAARQAPIASVWDPVRTIPVVGHRVETRREWDALKKERGIIEVSPRDSAVRDIHERKKFDVKAAAKQAVEGALLKAQRDELPPAPPPPSSRPVPDKRAILTPQEAAQEDRTDPRDRKAADLGTTDLKNPLPGQHSDSPEDAVMSMMRRNGWR